MGYGPGGWLTERTARIPDLHVNRGVLLCRQSEVKSRMISEFFGAFDRPCQFFAPSIRECQTDSSLSSEIGEEDSTFGFPVSCGPVFLRWALIVC